ncbi:MAG: formylglycine-generating enzyme family protein [Geminicoccaceae bacterium]
MASLQAGLQAGCDRLLQAGINPNAFGYLIDDIKAYQDAISPPVQEIQFTDVWRLGLLLHDHADAVSRDVDRLRPSLEDEQQAALNSLIGLHGPFILSSEDGRALQALAHENLATRDELGEFQEAAEAFIQAVEDSTDLVTDQVKDLIVAANQGIGQGRFPERHTATARTANQNFLSVVGKAAAFVGAAAAGAIIGDAVMTASVGREVATIGTQTIEAATNFLVTHEMVLKGLAAASGESLAWLPHLVNWIKAHRSQDNIASDMANRSPGPDFLPRMSGNDPLIQPPGTVFRDVDAPWCPEMVVIPPGSFAIGSREDEEGRLENERPRHRVAIKESFALGRYPVTFEEFDFFCSETGREKVDDRGWGRDRRPVINVSWIDAGQYCEWLTEKTGSRYILPSEAWWEYACRAGTTTRFTFGDELTKDQANFGGHVNKTTKVDAYPANAFGLFDMHGNVWEWCEDRYYASYDVALDDGSACVSGDNVRRVVRGGSWSEAVQGLRCACRDVGGVTYRYGSVGFRCARV